MSIWSTPEIRSMESGYRCYDCGEIIDEEFEGEKRKCEDCIRLDEIFESEKKLAEERN